MKKNKKTDFLFKDIVKQGNETRIYTHSFYKLNNNINRTELDKNIEHIPYIECVLNSYCVLFIKNKYNNNDDSIQIGGFLISSNIFCFYKNSIFDENDFSGGCLVNNQSTYQIKKIYNINSTISIAVLFSDIGNEIGYISMSNMNCLNETFHSRICISYNDKSLYNIHNYYNNNDDHDHCHMKNNNNYYIFAIRNSELSLVQLGKTVLTYEIIMKIIKINLKSRLNPFSSKRFIIQNGKNIKKYNLLKYDSIHSQSTFQDSLSLTKIIKTEGRIEKNMISINIDQVNDYLIKDIFSMKLSYLKLFLSAVNQIQNKINTYLSFINKSMISISHLDLSSCKLGDHGVLLLFANTSECNLKYLNLNTNNITDNGFEIIANVPFSCLSHLDLSFNLITSKGIKSLIKTKSYFYSFSNKVISLFSNKPSNEEKKETIFLKIVYLNLAWNRIDDEGIESLSNIHFKNLLYFNINYNKLTYKSIKSLSKVSKTHLLHMLEYFNIYGNDIDDKGIEYLSKILQNTIKTINISKCKLSYKSIESMFLNQKYINSNSTCLNDNKITFKYENLNEIQLSNNHISDKGVFFLSNLHFPHVKVIDLTNNYIGHIGMKYLSLMKTPNLTKLVLNSNQIGPVGVSNLALLNCPLLEALSLNWNMIESQSVEILFKMSIPLIKYIDISFNNIGNEAFEWVFNMRFTNIKEVNITGNQFGNNQFEKLSRRNYIIL